ncbi:M20/M25/M40 family metallo-hydrolase [Aquicella lusitana]|uniref:Leucyl aminopeptidase n=1 Tax=Aquicella lusitana TaxID=254246 RepID=A0A370G5X3_9COXI|nr:M20/M25/M40 family metallo-hydrolase [Aquicella lusitana]RDI39212.1 leucyl aminopeptidase [Aquicella lusitana]VVC74071.1 Bacterial leucyl aminopeptidase [Aquicella lusitana]
MLKKHNKLISFSLSLLAAASFATHAQPPTHQRIVVAPQCLIKNFSADYKLLASTTHLVLIETGEAGINQLIAEKHQQKTACGGFMDVTQDWMTTRAKARLDDNGAKSFLEGYEMPAQTSLAKKHSAYAIQYKDQVNQLLKGLNPESMWSQLTTLTTFPNRMATSDNGKNASDWIKNQVESMARETGHDDVTVYTVSTGNYKQPSVVAKLGNSNIPGIVIGGHMDTLSFSSNRQPGADDDGSGTVTVLETARILLSSGMHFKKPIYLIWYAAEEQGLIGSQYVVADFKKKNIPVEAVMQVDMTGYSKDKTMWLINDYVNQDLTAYLETLIKTYVNQPVQYTRCGYACSDHATWHKNGFAASMPFESSFGDDNPDVHSSKDTMDKLSLQHMTDYAKLAVAFAVELAEPIA